MHHFKTKEFRHRVRRKQCQRNRLERCCDNHCCCSAASATSAGQFLGFSDATGAICHRFRYFHSPQPQINKEKKKNYRASFHTSLFTICTSSLGWQIINPKAEFPELTCTYSEMQKFSRLPISYQSASENTLSHLFQLHCLKASFPLLSGAEKWKGNYNSALFFYHPSPRQWRKKELVPCLQPLAL